MLINRIKNKFSQVLQAFNYSNMFRIFSFRVCFCLILMVILVGSAKSNSLMLQTQNIGGGQKQIDATKTYIGLTVGANYVFSFDVLIVSKPFQISVGTTTLVVNAVGSYSISFTTTSTTQGINFFHQSGGQPAKLELDNLVLLKSEEFIGLACVAFSDNDYRFGFNGMEKDDEVKNGVGNHYDFGARCYDARLGRWLSIDSRYTVYPGLTPYHFAGNMPIKYIDKNGDWIGEIQYDEN